MASAQARLAEILGTTMLAAPDRAGDASAAVERAIELGERAWPQAKADWRFVNWFARALIVQAQLQRGRGRLEDAVSTLGRAVQRCEQAAQGRPADEGWMYITSGAANAHIYLAQLHDHRNMPSLGQPEQALAHFDQAEAVLRSHLAHPEVLALTDRNAAPGDTSSEVYTKHQLGTVIGGRAIVRLRQDDLEAARREIDAAMRLRRDNVAREPHNVAWRDGLMTEASTQALILLRLGKAEAALEASTLAWETMLGLARDEGAQSRWAGDMVRALVGAMHGRSLVANGRAAEGEALITLGVEYWAERCAAAPEDQSARLRLAAHLVHRAAAWLTLDENDGVREDAPDSPHGRRGGAREDALAALACLAEQAEAISDQRREREAQLTRAEAHAVLMQCADAGSAAPIGMQTSSAVTHRDAARALLLAAQRDAPLAADHARLLKRLAD
jgi:tetratricopeptide (TPR) repeat protein